MTIKRQLFFSYIRTAFITLGAFLVIGIIIAVILTGTTRPNQEVMTLVYNTYSEFTRRAIFLLTIAFFTICISIINIFISYHMTKRIVKPLDILNEGVRQIQNNNFSYLIDYQGDDEFHPVCEAFNGMAAKLETSIAKQKKDETNRRELIAGISHDLRTPLTSIKLYIEGLKTGVASTPEMQEKYFTTIENKTTEMEHIINQLFLFSKLDMDEFPLVLRQVDLILAITEMIKDTSSEYASRGLAITLCEMPISFHVSADVLMLQNVITNILENSVKYKSEEQGRMEISAAIADNSILLRLADNGPGVHADMLPKLFDIFYRTDPSRSKAGSGLGLAISAKIIERMGGKIYGELPLTGGLAIIIRLPLLLGGENNVEQ